MEDKVKKIMSEIFDVLYVVDINDNALDWCKDNLKCSLKLFSNLEQAIYENNELQNTVCVIANWGTGHYDVLIKLIQNGAKSFYVEKPFGRIFMKYGTPLFFRKDEDFDTCSQKLIKSIAELEH